MHLVGQQLQGLGVENTKLILVEYLTENRCTARNNMRFLVQVNKLPKGKGRSVT